MHLIEWFGIGAGSLLAIGALARALWRFNRRIVGIADAVLELVPNGGRSIKDTVTRTERKVDDAAQKVEEAAQKVDGTAQELRELKRRFEEHLSDGA